MITLDLKTLSPNTRFTDMLFIVKEANILKKKNDDLYMNALLENKTGTIKAVYWGDITDDVRNTITAGAIVSISGNVTQYLNVNQITINDYSPVNQAVDTSELIKEAPFPADQMYTMLETQVKAFKNNDYKVITQAFLDKYRDTFKTHPAAKYVHHGYKGGLLYHTCSILTLSKAVVAMYGEYIDEELLTAGIIMHDLGKLAEYTSYMGTEITLEGHLKGHISIMSEEIGRVADTLEIHDAMNVMKLQHMVLSHHGLTQNGWGSPVSPKLIEAHILHKLDSLDAEMDAYKSAMDQTNLHTFSNPIFGISKSKFFKHMDTSE